MSRAVQGLDYEKLGLRVGLEIHVQLDTREKLFCSCPTKLVEEDSVDVFYRELRPSRSEMGEVDQAAVLEWKKGRRFKYDSPRSASCLVEADEEPPHQMNREALEVALAVALSLNMRIVDEVYVMRKIVIDGSNVSGFQRTSLIAMNGWLEDEDGRVRIQTLCLEEDAARKMGESEYEVEYKLDRLGIPLVEIATAPDIHSPEQARRVAFKIGQLVRLTGRAKRGLGSIRQDVNISITGGGKVEIKGIQHLYMIPRVIEYETLRQLRLLEIREELRRRGVVKESLRAVFVDLTDLFRNTQSKLIKRLLTEKNAVVYGLKLAEFKGLLGLELQPGRRFGTELADYARVWAGVGGLIHSDELPGYGITVEEVNEVYRRLGANPERDAFVLVVDERSKALRALEIVLERVKVALDGVPEETRAANPDGTTRYMRPRPGGARMYPETDIPPILITGDLIESAKRLVPEPFEAKLERFVRDHGLSRELATSVINDIRLDLYERLVEKWRGKVPPVLIASTIANTLRMLENEGVRVENIEDEHIEKVIDLVAAGKLVKDAIPDVLREVSKEPERDVEEVVRELGLSRISESDVLDLVDKIVKENLEKLKSRRDKAFNIVMSEAMKVLRGRVEGSLVADIVKRRLRELDIM
ncbi:glutamyl-tRNA(Gln) amidotransferase subunit E [Thermogladius calderae 1633]|uniref:Glutamyl-tRNA(Gln) amidotransferase subunit E n=1 Tax=Thermogladius calderae (strain DSM 22663 / VKM B-2946 / 1633) TaxID=1184251 RepID=I3TCI8_THEC1|nr:Glu-tRNA(Gln) amidotransferase subunit GatE [Thermogladius calderae]AFK50476.1 glutamyl-tRNA(Gln) amidotransferase subunit E [Thermogladius calderae 1633]